MGSSLRASAKGLEIIDQLRKRRGWNRQADVWCQDAHNTGALSWRDSAPQVSQGLANLIDDLMAPFPGKRPLSTQEILQRLETPTRFPSKSSLQKPHLKWLVALNVGLFILQIVTGVLWFQAKQQSTDSGSDRQSIRGH